MRIKSITGGVFIFLAMAFGVSTVATADTADRNTPPNVFDTTTNSFTFQGQRYSLLDTYANPDLARNSYVSQYEDVLQQIKNTESLPPLEPEVAAAYKQAVISKVMDGEEELRPLAEFLDMYENSAENAQIIDQLKNANNQVLSGELTEDQAVSFARMLLPTKLDNNNSYSLSMLLAILALISRKLAAMLKDGLVKLIRHTVKKKPGMSGDLLSIAQTSPPKFSTQVECL